VLLIFKIRKRELIKENLELKNFGVSGAKKSKFERI